ncbi:FAD-dependent monooxygenase [Kribbella sp. NBC_01245]|uniref:FAD-dependent monooxygenase n=1 Tax=Kribbella sp. NBC_01245 TaxID=2903578 RepID=UPI002E27EAF5|nr:FAD-dependent monooxygenase [Kribbella sp. NBC_01245]
MVDRNAVIVGAGIGGLAAAIALHRRGWNITVLERAPALREVGAGISLWPNAIRALDLLGVGDQVREFSTVEGAGGFRDAHGRWLFRSPLRTGYGDTLMLRRPILLDILRSAVPAEAIVLDTTVNEVERTGDQVTVTHDGVRRSADLLVGADGLRSTVRALLWPHAKPPVYAGYTTWRLIAPPLELDSEVSESWGQGERVGIFRLADGAVYSYLVANAPPGSEYADDRAELRHRFGRWHDPIPAMLDSINGSEILRHDIYRLPALRSYVAGRAVLVGDAAHAMTPDLGQGGGTASEDAVELAAALNEDGNVDHGLQVYDRRRRRRTQAIARQSAAFGTFAQASGRLTVPLRNTAARLLPERLFLRANHATLTWRSTS